MIVMSPAGSETIAARRRTPSFTDRQHIPIVVRHPRARDGVSIWSLRCRVLRAGGMTGAPEVTGSVSYNMCVLTHGFDADW